MNYIAWLNIILSGLFVTAGDYFLKVASKGTINWTYFWIGTILYALPAINWYFILKNSKLATASITFQIVTSMMVICLSLFYFHEHLSHKEILGLIFGVAAIICFS